MFRSSTYVNTPSGVSPTYAAQVYFEDGAMAPFVRVDDRLEDRLGNSYKVTGWSVYPGDFLSGGQIQLLDDEGHGSAPAQSVTYDADVYTTGQVDTRPAYQTSGTINSASFVSGQEYRFRISCSWISGGDSAQITAGSTIVDKQGQEFVVITVHGGPTDLTVEEVLKAGMSPETGIATAYEATPIKNLFRGTPLNDEARTVARNRDMSRVDQEGGAKTFLELTDVFAASYTGQANKFVRVKGDEAGLEFLGIDPLSIQGAWDASTNDPDISSETITGHFWIVSVAGTTDIGGITDWEIGDWVVKTETGWTKVDNTELGYWTRDAVNKILYPINNDTLRVDGNVGNDGPVFSDQLISGADLWTSIGWTGDWENGWTHTVGNLEPLVLETVLTQGKRYYVAVTSTLATFGRTATTSVDGRSFSNRNPSVGWGFVITGATSKITVTPDIDTWNGTIVVRLYEYTEASKSYVNLNDRIDIRSPLFSGGISSTFFGRACGQWCTGRQNVGYGLDSLTQLTTGNFNHAFGYNALQNVDTGSFNIGIGRASMRNLKDGSYNIALGDGAQQDRTTGSENLALGGGCMYRNIDGNQNVTVGNGSLYSNASGSRNTVLGYKAAYGNLGSDNLFLGYHAGYNETGSNKFYVANSATATPLIYGEFDTPLLRVHGQLTCPRVSTALNNEFFGIASGNGALTGSNNTGLGRASLFALTTGSGNTALGAAAGNALTTGANNTFVGLSAAEKTTTAGDCTIMGRNAGSAYPLDARSTFYGAQAGRYLTGPENILMGAQAGMGPNAAGNSAYQNVLLGTYTAYQITSGNNNVISGHAACLALTTGARNLILGSGAGGSLIIGSGNVFLGYQSGGAETGSNKLYVANSSGTPLVYGEFDTPLLRVNAPQEVVGNLSLTGASRTLSIGTAQSSCVLSMPRSGSHIPITMTTSGTGLNIAGCADVTLTDINARFGATTGRFVRLQTGNNYTYLHQIDTPGKPAPPGDPAFPRYSRVAFGHDSATENSGIVGYYTTFFGGMANDYTNMLIRQSAGQTADLLHFQSSAAAKLLAVKTTGAIYNDANSVVFDSEIKLKVYKQDEMPALAADGNVAIWEDTNDSNKVYWLYRRGAADIVSVEMS